MGGADHQIRILPRLQGAHPPVDAGNARRVDGDGQEELAKRCGVSRQTINAIENNKYDPTLALAFALANELGTTVDELFTP